MREFPIFAFLFGIQIGRAGQLLGEISAFPDGNLFKTPGFVTSEEEKKHRPGTDPALRYGAL